MDKPLVTQNKNLSPDFIKFGFPDLTLLTIDKNLGGHFKIV